MGMNHISKDFDRDDLVDFNGKSDKPGKEYENDHFVGEVSQGYLYHFDLNQSRTGLPLDGHFADRIADDNNEEREDAIAQIDEGIIRLDVGPDGPLYITTTRRNILRLALLPRRIYYTTQ